MTLQQLNMLSGRDAREAFFRCCGSTQWAARMEEHRPFDDPAGLLKVADNILSQLTQEDWHEAFSHHPKIGDVNALREKFAATASWAEGEQAGTKGASDTVLHQLAGGNADYERKFGYIFIVCASGKTAAEMLALLRRRLLNTPDNEIRIAAKEQRKITQLRLRKLLDTTTAQ